MAPPAVQTARSDAHARLRRRATWLALTTASLLGCPPWTPKHQALSLIDTEGRPYAYTFDRVIDVHMPAGIVKVPLPDVTSTRVTLRPRDPSVGEVRVMFDDLTLIGPAAAPTDGLPAGRYGWRELLRPIACERDEDCPARHDVFTTDGRCVRSMCVSDRDTVTSLDSVIARCLAHTGGGVGSAAQRQRLAAVARVCPDAADDTQRCVVPPECAAP